MKNVISTGVLATIFGTTVWLNAAAKKDEKPADNPSPTRPPLNIDQEMHLSDTNGIIHQNMIVSLKVMDNIRIYLTDGTLLTGYVKEVITEVSVIDKSLIYKVYGEMNNKNNAGFGFVLTSTDIFAGAVIFRDSGDTYTVVYNPEIKGYILNKRSNTQIKPSSIKKEKKELTPIEVI